MQWTRRPDFFFLRAASLARSAGALALILATSVPPANATERKEEEKVEVFKSPATPSPVRKKIDRAGPGLTAEDVVRKVDAKRVGELRAEAFRDLEDLVAATGKTDPERPELLYRLGEVYWELSKGERFRARALDDPIYDCDAARDAGPRCAAARRDRARFDASSRKYLMDAFRAYLEVIKSHAGWVGLVVRHKRDKEEPRSPRSVHAVREQAPEVTTPYRAVDRKQGDSV